MIKSEKEFARLSVRYQMELCEFPVTTDSIEWWLKLKPQDRLDFYRSSEKGKMSTLIADELNEEN